jgi:hypothetical protein
VKNPKSSQNIDYAEALDFCQWLNAQTAVQIRWLLPSHNNFLAWIKEDFSQSGAARAQKNQLSSKIFNDSNVIGAIQIKIVFGLNTIKIA